MDPDVILVDDPVVPVHSSAQAPQPRQNLQAQTPQPQGSEPQNAKGDEPLERLEKALENACQTLYALSSGIQDFSYDNQHVIFSKVNEFVRDLRDIDNCSKNVNAIIPAEVIEAVDKGRNPEWCTFHMLCVYSFLVLFLTRSILPHPQMTCCKR